MYKKIVFFSFIFLISCKNEIGSLTPEEGFNGTTSVNADLCDNVSAFSGLSDITDIKDSQVVLKWSPETASIGHTIFEKTNNGDLKFVKSVSASSTTYLVDNLTPSTDYEFLVKSISKNGSYDCNNSIKSVRTAVKSQFISCKEINDFYNNSKPSGVYSLAVKDKVGNTINVEAYCDMTTDGGGWTLIGRGRENWAWSDAGLNSLNTHLGIGTVNAFTPAYYSSNIVEAVLANNSLTSLTDGIRIKRVAFDSPDGTRFQEARWHYTAKTNWTWVFDSTISISRYEVDGVHLVANNTRDNMNNGNNEKRIFTWAWGGHNNIKGFSYGSTVGVGTNSSSNFLWENGSERHSIPYSEVYVRD